MRDIKYRVWHKTAKEMRLVYSLHFDAQQVIVGVGTLAYVDDTRYATFHMTSEVELLEYTGRKDRNGVEIYEGDLIHRPDIGIAMLVRWNAESAGFDLTMKDPANFNATTLWYVQASQTDYEVLGNLYEHPELFVEHK